MYNHNILEFIFIREFMLYRMNISELSEITDIASLDDKVVVYFIKCPMCSYKRISYSLDIIMSVCKAHIHYTHPKEMIDNKNIVYKMVTIDKDLYLQLHDVVLID